MDDFFESMLGWVREIGWAGIARALFVLLFSAGLGRLLSAAVSRWAGGGDPQRRMLLRRATFYPVLLLGGMGALRELGFDLSVLLGAAGVLTVAVGFASQTSASNLISGLFLIGERAFGVGDTIRVGTLTGEVLSVDLLSVKLRTFDNLYVRLPNETLIKSELTNLSRFELRRIDLLLRVGYGEDLERVRGILEAIAHDEPRILEEPKPIFLVQDFEANGVLLQFSVWVRRQIFLEVRSALQVAVRRRFDEERVAVPSSRWILEKGEL